MIQLLSILVCTLAMSALADQPLDIRLVSEVTMIRPGQPFYVGLALHHGAGYHTYWKHPGIVGVPTSIQWNSLPEGFKAEPIDWPEPEHVLMFTIHAQGYERDVVLPIRITPPQTLVSGTRVRLEGKASWMCCARQCNPGFVDLSIELPVLQKETADFDPVWHPKFETERALRPLQSQAWTSEAWRTKDQRVLLTLIPKAGAAMIKTADTAKIRYYTEDGMVDSNQPQVITARADGAIQFELKQPEYLMGDPPAELQAVVMYPPGWEADGKVRCMIVRAPLRLRDGKQADQRSSSTTRKPTVSLR